MVLLSEKCGCVVNKEPWPPTKKELKESKSCRGEQIWEDVFSHGRLQTARSGRGKPDKAMHTRPNTWHSLKVNTTSESKQRPPGAGPEPSSTAWPAGTALSSAWVC